MTQILDCTLRDGGFKTNWLFEPSYVSRYIEEINLSPISIVELGYINPAQKNRGPYFSLDDSLINELSTKLVDGKKVSVMADLKFWIHNLKIFIEKVKVVNPNILRLAASIENILPAIKFSKVLKKELQSDTKIFLNITHTKSLLKSPRERVDLSNFDALYIVDSYGSLTIDETKELVEWFQWYEKPIGFHGHNNQGLALPIWEAIKDYKFVQYVDSTMNGLGRGAGNLKTEELLYKIYQYQLEDSDLLDYWNVKYDFKYFISGINDVHPNEA